MEDYKKQYQLLNSAQKSAVDHIEGPLLVIAGPGTGKTQLLAMRVANILRSTDTEAANILCLTFTNKASINMKERIIQLAGPGAAKTVVKTFHSFAGEIMNSYPDYFWSAASLNVAPQSIQLDIIESIVSKLPLDNPLALRFAGQFTLIGDIQRSINLAKDAGLTPDKLKAIIQSNLAYIDVLEDELVSLTADRLSLKSLDKLAASVESLPGQNIDKDLAPLISLSTMIQESLHSAIDQDLTLGKTSQTGKWKKDWVQAVDGQKGMHRERQRNQWWLQLADVYAAYREEIHQRGFYDYADMLVEVITQLENHPDLLSEVQERFLYVLIDEFQDTNPAQLRLAHLITDHYVANGRPNLMAVGDDDQSIFKFNGAELNNMLGFRRSYKTAKTIVLTENYRSSQEVLNSATKVIEQADDRLVKRDHLLSKNLVAKNKIKPGQIQATSYSSRDLQLSSVARLIKKSYRPDQTTAVLARNHDGLLKMAGLLQSLNVPVRYEQQSNILEHEIVEQIYLIVSIIQAISDGDKDQVNTTLHQTLRHPMWNIEPTELWALASDNFYQPDWLNCMLKNKSADIKDIAAWLVDMAKQSANQPLAVSLEQIIGLKKLNNYTSPLRQYFLQNSGQSNKYLASISAIQLLRALVHEFSTNQQPSLNDFTRLIEVNRDNKKVIADESPFVTGRNAVQLLTIHKAKGLEFDSIYLIDAIEKNWSPSKGSRRPPANLPLLPAGDNFDDYARLMYVALTRAKANIFVNSYHTDHAGKEVAESTIVQSAFDIVLADETNQATIIEILEENLAWPQLNDGSEQEILRARLETYSLSVTHLLNFLDLKKGGPQYFKEKNLLRLPEAKSPHLAYGTAMHAALQQAQLLTNQDKFQLGRVQARFAESLGNEQLTTAEYSKFARQGKQILKRLFTDYNYETPKGSLAEQDIKQVRLKNAVIRGTLDRLDQAGEVVKIIDYKTGKPLHNLHTQDQTKIEKAWRQKTQLIFYALLLKNSARFSKLAGKSVEGKMIYVEAETKKELELSYTPTDDEIANLAKLIEVVYARITKLELPDVSKYSPDFAGTQAFEKDLLEGKV